MAEFDIDILPYQIYFIPLWLILHQKIYGK